MLRGFTWNYSCTAARSGDTQQQAAVARALTSTQRFASQVQRLCSLPHAVSRSTTLRSHCICAAGSTLATPAPTSTASGSNGRMVATNHGRVDSLRNEVAAAFRTALTAAYPDQGEQPVVAQCNNPKFGDYQVNNAMALFGRLKGKEGAPKAPRAVAEAVVAALPATEAIASTSLAGPGFINVKLNQQWLGERIRRMLIDGVSTWAPPLPAGIQRVVVDFSSPNVAKEMHVGHLRSTIIGDTIARTLAFCGGDVLRLNHVGDWGTQFGMLIQHIAETKDGGLQGLDSYEVSDLQVLYKASKVAFDTVEGFPDRARKAVTLLQAGDPAHLAAWDKICAASRKEFQAIYDRLGVTLTERGESFYNPMLRDLVDDLMARGVAQESEGAKVVFVEGLKNPLIIQKSDGGYLYGTTDMAAVKHRTQTEKGDWIIYVTDQGQAGHFEQVFGAARKAGFVPADAAALPRIDHVGFGLVLGMDGKRIRTRDSGAAVRLVELLDEARDRCRDTIRERRADIPAEELEHASAVMGYAAVKYADLKNQRLTNYKFNMDDMISLKGNTAVYQLYAHARIAAIGRKAGMTEFRELAENSTIDIQHEKEAALALQVARFPEAVEAMVDELAPNRITEYLYDLTDKFNGFYEDCQVVGSEQQASRLLLCEATAVVMRQCFELLGMTPLYRI